jgi:hypothetical protein
MLITNSDAGSVINTDEVRTIYPDISKNGESFPFMIKFYYKRVDSWTAWTYETEEERNKTLKVIKAVLGVKYISKDDIVLL